MSQRTWVGFMKDSIWRKKSKVSRNENDNGSHDDWAWFLNAGNQDSNDTNVVDFEALAKSRQAIKAALFKNPNLLFKVVEESDNGENKTLFVDLVIKEKSLREADLVSVGKHVKLDWGQIATKLRISNNLLEKYRGQMDWVHISKSDYYIKNAEFIDRFGKQLVWTDSMKLKVDKADVERLVFVSKNMSIANAILCCPELLIECLNDSKESNDSKKLNQLSEEDWKNIVSKNDLIIAVEALSDPDGIVKNVLEKMPIILLNACLRNKYLSKHGHIFKEGSCIEGKGFFETCKADEAYLLKHGIIGYNTSNTLWKEIIDAGIMLSNETIVKYAEAIDWNALTTREVNPVDVNEKYKPNEPCLLKYIPDSVVLSKSKGLPAKYIDKNAFRVNWSEICEYQVLPEWLMRKHIDKLDWEKVKAFQTLSPDFIKDFGYKMGKST